MSQDSCKHLGETGKFCAQCGAAMGGVLERNKTLILIVLDESGSMTPKKADVIGGFNTFLAEQAKLGDDARLSLTKFNTKSTVVHAGIPLSAVPHLTEHTYTPGGNTALYDAIAESVRLADKDQRSDERVLCLIMTDGEENSSRETTLSQVREIIQARTARGDWTFAYIGEHADRWAYASGTPTGNVQQDSIKDPKMSFLAASAATQSYRGSAERSSASFWKGSK